MRLAYLLGLTIGPFALLAGTYAWNAGGPESCTHRSDVALATGERILVRHCTGRLGLSVRDPEIVAYLD